MIWVRDARVYLVSSDSLAVADGARLTFVFRGRTVATGEVARIVDDGMVIARLTWGSLPREKDLKRLRILSEPARAPRTLRVGYPSPVRSTLFFACERLTLTPPFPPGSYRADSSGHSYQLISDAAAPAGASWPETLSIRQFDEVADEEIALERGEVDVAVFWPGELSTHMRDQPRWQHDLSAPMPRGVVVALCADSAATIGPGDPLMPALDRELFRGDLDERRFGFGRPAKETRPSAARIQVDAKCPGREVVERFLSRNQSGPPSKDAPLVRIKFVDQPVSSPDLIEEAHTEFITVGPGGVTKNWGTADSLTIQGLFAIDCPVVFEARLRPYVASLGAKAFVELFDCKFAGIRR